jgi:hypothetical protein
MNEVGTKNLQAFSQSFDLMLNIFFRGGSFVKPVTDVDVHEHLELANEERKPVLSKSILHPEEMLKRGNRMGNFGDATFLGIRMQPGR